MSSTMINIILIILCFLFGSLPLLIPFLKGNHKRDDSFFTNHKTLVAVSFFLILGSLVRVSFLDSFPSTAIKLRFTSYPGEAVRMSCILILQSHLSPY